MPDTAWKAWERRVAAIFGGKRRGAYTGDRNHGKTDVVVSGWAIEVKLLSRPSFQDLLDATQQAETNAESPSDIPVAIVKRKGDHDIDALVVMRLERFREYFVGESHE